MPIFSDKFFRDMSCKDDGLDQKVYEVQDNNAYFYTGRVIQRVTNFSAMADGIYPFGEERTVNGHMISPWLLIKPPMPNKVELDMFLIGQLHKMMKTLLAARFDKELIPLVKLTLERFDNRFFVILETDEEGSVPAMTLRTDEPIQLLDSFADHTFAMNALELRDFLAMFASLKLNHGRALLEYGPHEFVHLSFSHQGHHLLAATPFEREKKDKKDNVEEAKNAA